MTSPSMAHSPDRSAPTGWAAPLALLLCVLAAALATPAAASAAPVNDNFADAIELTGDGATTTGDSTGGGREAGEPAYASLGSPGGPSVWWRWTSARTRSVVLDTCGSAPEALVTVFSGASLGALTERQWSFERCAGGWTIRFVATAGVEYHIAVVATGAAGPIALHLHAPPPNDDFADASVLTGPTATVVGTNDGAGPEPSEPAHPENGRASVWYRWVAPASGQVALSTCGSTSVKRAGVYTGATLATLAAVPTRITICGLQSVTTFTATAGVTYNIAVDAPLHAPGDIVLKLAPPPVNDELADATTLTGATATATGTNVGADTEDGEPTAGGGGSTVWWRWTSTDRRLVTVDTCASTFTTALAVFTGSDVGSLQRVAEEPSSCGDQSRVTFTAQPGVTYRIQVDGYFGTTGDIALHLDAPPPPPNDSFANAATLSGSPATASGTNANATLEPGEPDHGFFGTTTVWWSWTAPANRRVVLDTCASAFDTRLDVFTGATLGTLTPVAANDDACGTRSRVTFVATAGTTYSIRVNGRFTGGAIVLNLVPASNDAFADAIELSGFAATSTASNVGATAEPGEPNHAGLPGGTSLWWRWTAPASGRLTVDTCASSVDTLLAVYTGSSIGFLSELASSDDACGAGGSRVTFAVSAGADVLHRRRRLHGRDGPDRARAVRSASARERRLRAGRRAERRDGERDRIERRRGPRGRRAAARVPARRRLGLVALDGADRGHRDGLDVRQRARDAHRDLHGLEREHPDRGRGRRGLLRWPERRCLRGGRWNDVLHRGGRLHRRDGRDRPRARGDRASRDLASGGAPTAGSARSAAGRAAARHRYSGPRRRSPAARDPAASASGRPAATSCSGTAGTDILFGRGGPDVLRGQRGADCLYGDAGADSLTGGAGNDALFGGDGNDRLTDADGRDRFSGGRGNDTINARDRSVSGRRAADTVACGAGSRDRAFVDRRDRVARDCEIVRRR